MKTIVVVGDESVLERAKKYRIPLKLEFPAKRETTELPVHKREWMTFEERMRRKFNGR